MRPIHYVWFKWNFKRFQQSTSFVSDFDLNRRWQGIWVDSVCLIFIACTQIHFHSEYRLTETMKWLNSEKRTVFPSEKYPDQLCFFFVDFVQAKIFVFILSMRWIITIPSNLSLSRNFQLKLRTKNNWCHFDGTAVAGSLTHTLTQRRVVYTDERVFIFNTEKIYMLLSCCMNLNFSLSKSRSIKHAYVTDTMVKKNVFCSLATELMHFSLLVSMILR